MRKAVVLAAGRGTRMGEITAQIPKPMLLVHGQPLLEHILEALAAAGVEEFLIVVGYHREIIEDHFRNWRLPVQFCVQDPVDGTGTAARLARGFAGSDPFLLTFGDILSDPGAYVRCARLLEDNPATVAVLGVKNVDDPWRGAAVYVENGFITRVIEKPPQGTSTTRWDSAGLYALTPLAFPYLDRLTPSARNEYELTSIFGMMIADGLELRISPMDESLHIGLPADLNAANH